jgi:hypothetical protein
MLETNRNRPHYTAVALLSCDSKQLDMCVYSANMCADRSAVYTRHAKHFYTATTRTIAYTQIRGSNTARLALLLFRVISCVRVRAGSQNWTLKMATWRHVAKAMSTSF